MSWNVDDWIVRREVLPGGPWQGVIVRVLEDSPDWLVTYIPEASPFGFPAGKWPTPDHRHPWADRSNWQGPGCLMLQAPGERYAIWHFWHGPARDFACWYINLQEPFRRTSVGYDTQDLELDVIVYPDGAFEMKDEALLDQRVEEGRFDAALAESVHAQGAAIGARLAAGERWWPLEWRDWQPDPGWEVPSALPVGWDNVPWL